MTALVFVEPKPRVEIVERLGDIEREHEVRLLFAVESGNRAWGLPSPDFHHDVRFVYVHGPECYLSVEQQETVITLAVGNRLMFTGWDLRAVLDALVQPKSVPMDWLLSPMVYSAEGEAVVKIMDFVRKAAEAVPRAHRYLHLCEKQYRCFIEGQERVMMGAYIKTLRSALALMWLRQYPDRPVPLNFRELRTGLAMPAGLSTFLDEMIARNARTKEMGEGPPLVLLDSLIEGEIARAERALPEAKPPSPGLRQEADALFRELVLGC